MDVSHIDDSQPRCDDPSAGGVIDACSAILWSAYECRIGNQHNWVCILCHEEFHVSCHTVADDESIKDETACALG